MIQITAYLRTEEDLALWKALPNKTEWLHSMLVESSSMVEQRPVKATVGGSTPPSPANYALSSSGRTRGVGSRNSGSTPDEAMTDQEIL